MASSTCWLKSLVLLVTLLLVSHSNAFCPVLPSAAFVPFRPCIHRARRDNCEDLIDCNNLNELDRRGAFIDYAQPLNPDADFEKIRATQAIAFLTKRSLADGSVIGSDANPSIIPPGFQEIRDDGCSPHRGHMIGNQLGGSGESRLNLVALVDQANWKMVPWENRVKTVFDGLDDLDDTDFAEYTVTANYKARQLHPVSMRLVLKLRTSSLKYCDLQSSTFDPITQAPVFICNCSQTLTVFDVIIDNDKTATESIVEHNRFFLRPGSCRDEL